MWSDNKDLPIGAQFRGHGRLAILARVKQWKNFDEIKKFTKDGDRRFFLEARGRRVLSTSVSVGGITTPTQVWIVFRLRNGSGKLFRPNIAYTLRPRNDSNTHEWVVEQGLTLTRD